VTCNAVGSFRPLPNKKYEILYFGVGYTCKVKVIQIVEDGQQIPVQLGKAYSDVWTATNICDKK